MMDRTLGDTFYILFTTRSFSTGAPATLSGTPVVSAYPNGSVTQLTAGITLGVDHDSVTGLNLLTIVATSGNGYAAATDYSLVITTGTVGGVSVVGEVVGQFSLGLDASYKRLGAPAGASVSADIADVPTVSEFNARTLAAADYFDPAADTVATVTTLTNLPAITSNWLTAAGIAAGALDGKGNWNIGKTGYTLTQTFPANFADFAITATTGKVTAENVTLAAATHTGAVIPTVSTLTGHTPQTADHTANIAAILTDTGTTLETHLTDIKGATFSGSTDSLEAIRDRGDAAWTTGAGGSDRLLMVDTTIATLATQTSFTLTAGSADNDAYNNCTIVVEDVATSTQKAVGMVIAYTGATKTVTLKEALAFTISATDKVYILAENSLKSTVANRQLDVTTTGAAGIDWGNVENQATSVDLSATDIQLCDTVTTNTDMRGTDSAALASVVTEARMSELDAGTAGKMANQVDIIQTDTTTDIPATITTLQADTDDIQAQIGTAGAGLTDLGGMSTAMKAQVNAEVVDTLNTDTYAEPGQGAPLATTSIAAKINYLYKAWRNKSTQTATTYSLYDDAGTTVDQKATVSDDATTATKGEVDTGP